LFGLVIAYRVYRTLTNRYRPLWISLLGAWTCGWVVIDAATTKYGGTDLVPAFTPGPGVGCFVVAIGSLLAVAAGIAFWRIQRNEAPAQSVTA
jgi:hypothetical protein